MSKEDDGIEPKFDSLKERMLTELQGSLKNITRITYVDGRDYIDVDEMYQLLEYLKVTSLEEK